MRRLLARLRPHCEGGSAVEFALTAPVMLLLVVGAINLGPLFEAWNGVQHAVGEAARKATLYPRPTDADIIAAAQLSSFGLDPANADTPTVTHGTANGQTYAEVTVSYRVPMNFPMFNLPSVPLSYTKRVYQP